MIDLVAPPTSYSSVLGQRFFDMREDRVTFEVTDSGLGTKDNLYEIKLSSPDGDYLKFRRQNADLIFMRLMGSSSTTANVVTYNPAEHKFLRFVHHGTDVTWETSGTGAEGTFTIAATAPDVLWAETVSLDLFATRLDTQFNVHLAGVHGGTSTVGACPIAELQDDFSGPALAPVWARSVTYYGTHEQVGDELVITNIGNGSALSSRIVPLRLYDLRGGAFTVEITQMFDPSQMIFLEVAVAPLTGTRSSFEIRQGTLTARQNGNILASTAYSTSAQRYLRISENGGTVKWEVSPDGQSFTALHQDTLTGFDRVDVVIEARDIVGSAVVTSAHIGSINITPP